jgi:hypothetical protein
MSYKNGIPLPPADAIFNPYAVYRPASLLIHRFGLDGLQSFRGSREFASGDGREWDDRFRRLKRCFDDSID